MAEPDPWGAFSPQPQPQSSDPWAAFIGPSTAERPYAHLGTQDVRSLLVPDPVRAQAELDLRMPRGLPKSPEEMNKERLKGRGYMERAGDAAAFVASLPVRMLTRGEYGTGDVLGLISPQAGQALRRSEHDFIDANPGTMWTLGAAGEVMAGVPALNTMGGLARMPRSSAPSQRVLGAEARATEAAADMAAFDRSNVRQFGPSLNEGPVAGTAKHLSDTLFVGGPVKSALETSLEGARNRTAVVAERYGGAMTAEQTGHGVRQGIERFRDARPTEVVERQVGGYTPTQRAEIIAQPARETSLKTKQAALYERAWDYIPEPMREGRAVQGAPRIMGGMPNTRAVLEDVAARNLRMINASADGAERAAQPIATSGMVGRMIDAIGNNRWTASLQTMRDIRSDFRRLASGIGDTEKNTLRLSDIERVQGGITRDMIGLLERNAAAYQQAGQTETAASIERAITAFRRADQFTALSVQRLEAIERFFNAPDATTLYRNVSQAALGRDRGNIEALRTLRRTLREDELSTLASGVIRQLGEPVGLARGATERLGFSVSSFMTRWNNMSPEAKGLLFRGPHRAALDDLVRVNRRLANVEAWTNTSRSGNAAVNVGSVMAGGGAYAAGGLETLLGSLAAGGTASLVMGSETYARWMIGYLRARAAIYRSGAGASETARLTASVNQLGYLMQQDRSLEPVYRAVVQDNGGGHGR